MTPLKDVARLKKLEFLSLAYTPVTDKGLKELVELKRLNTLVLIGDAVTVEGVKELQDGLRVCRIAP